MGSRLKRSVVLALGLGLSVVLSTAAQAHSLGDALRSAYNHSGLLAQNRALLRAADEDVAQAAASLKPILNWQAQYSFSKTNSLSFSDTLSVSLNGSYTLYDFGRNQLSVDRVKETVLGTRQALLAIEQDVLLRAVNAFMNVRLTNEIVSLRRNNLGLIERELQAARDRFDVGEVTRTDVATAQARLAASRSNLALAQGDLKRAKAEFQAAVGRMPGSLSQPPRAPALRSLGEAIAIARRSHPALKEIEHSIAAASLSVESAKRSILPTVTLGTGLSLSEGGTTSLTGNITASGPIYQGGRLASVERQAIARRDALNAALHATRHQVEQNVRNAYAFLEAARATAQASDQQIRAARVAFRGVREEATLGARTTLDVLNAEQELLNAQSDRIAAGIDEYVRTYQALSAMGLLTAEHLRLGVQTYDPTAYYNLVKDAPAALSAQGKALDRVLKGLGN